MITMEQSESLAVALGSYREELDKLAEAAATIAGEHGDIELALRTVAATSLDPRMRVLAGEALTHWHWPMVREAFGLIVAERRAAHHVA